MKVEPRAPFGAAVAWPAGPASAPLAQLLAEHQLLVLTGERSDGEHIALISTLGRVLPQGPRVQVGASAPTDAPIITHITNRGAAGLGDFELLFHHDLAHTPAPHAGLSLYAIDVDAGQVPTRFASGIGAYERLDAARREQLAGLQGLFVGNYTTITAHSRSARDVKGTLDPRWPFAVHPLVVRHPQSQRPCLFVNEMQTVSIVGLPERESDALLDELFEVLYDPDYIYEHHWQQHDLVVWDNIALQHSRPPVSAASPRVLRRVVWGERAPWENWRASS